MDSSASDDNIARGTPSPVWAVKEYLHLCLGDLRQRKLALKGRPARMELSSETERLFQNTVVLGIAVGKYLHFSPRSSLNQVVI